MVGKDTDSNFLCLFFTEICTYAVVTSSCLVWFFDIIIIIIIFWKLDPLCNASAMAKGGLEVVCDLRERPGSTMMVLRDDF